jgi:hypothetical protein
MSSHRIVSLVIVWMLALTASSAHAFFDPPWITPAAPRAGDSVSLNVSGGICDVFVEWPGYPQITRTGNSIRIVEYGNHETFEDFCNYGYWTVTEPIGAFASGDYTITVDFVYDDYPFGLATVTLGVIPFSVVGAASTAEAPASTASGRIALLVLIGCVALRSLRMRRH